ncbi:MAG: response regulator transcription factor [Chloroflexi bacterium]|nr:response regulator transcription factor [Chloroflexota bacterium]
MDAPPAGGREGNGRPRTVIVVDDEPAFRQFTGALLAGRPEFVVVGEAGSGEEALALAARLRPHVVVLDVLLPGLNGFAVCRQLRALLAGVRVVLVSAHDEGEFARLAPEAGAAAFLPKRALTPVTLLRVTT